MDANQQSSPENLVALTADVVAAYVSNNTVPADQIANVISSVHASFSGIMAPPKPQEPERPVPRIPIKKTITPDYLVSLEDGRQYKSLKRHLSGRGLTPQEYRAKWGLASDYPMVAPNYAQRRSELAKASGLGQKRKKDGGSKSAAEKPKGRGGRKKAA